LFRNIDIAFEKEIERNPGTRELAVDVTLDCRETGRILVSALSEDGRCLPVSFDCGDQVAENRERMQGMFASQIGKSAGHYRFNLESLLCEEKLPFVSSSALNGNRRTLAEELDRQSCIKKDILHRQPGRNPLMHKSPDGVSYNPPPFNEITYKQNVANKLSAHIYKEAGANISELTFENSQAHETAKAYELTHCPDAELMRTKYCIRYELGICPKFHKAKDSGRLYLINNGQRFSLHFDCRNCEMIVKD
jgi:putative protease